jgi:hypothetical protein
MTQGKLLEEAILQGHRWERHMTEPYIIKEVVCIYQQLNSGIGISQTALEKIKHVIEELQQARGLYEVHQEADQRHGIDWIHFINA